jgi:hypothetical protein
MEGAKKKEGESEKHTASGKQINKRRNEREEKD